VEAVLAAGIDVEPELLDDVSVLGSGTAVIGVYRQRWSEPGGRLSVYLHGVGDPGNVGTIIRSVHAFADGPVILGPRSADPFSPKAVRASMGSIFARPPARAGFSELAGTRLALHAGAPTTLSDVEVEAPVVVCVGAEREGLPAEVLQVAEIAARIPLRRNGPDSLNAALAATLAVYDLRMAADA
jgi:TrmH family RNA methyltransferase